jgi:hypothetical protein
MEGYGTDRQSSLGAFPFVCDWGEVCPDTPPSEKHIELRKQLEQMGTCMYLNRESIFLFSEIFNESIGSTIIYNKQFE